MNRFAILIASLIILPNWPVCLAQDSAEPLRGFGQLADIANRSNGQFCAIGFYQLATSPNHQPRDTSPVFRFWMKFDKESATQPRMVSEVWFDWSLAGSPPPVATRPNEVVILRSSAHPALVSRLTSLLTAESTFPRSVYRTHPKSLSNLISQCLALGEHPKRDLLTIGMIECEDASRVVDEHDLHLLARVGGESLLVSQSAQNLMRLDYCEPVGASFSIYHFGELSRSIRQSMVAQNGQTDSWPPNVIGQEGFQLVDPLGRRRSRLYHRDRPYSVEVHTAHTTRFCPWVKRCRQQDVERLNRVQGTLLLVGLAVCSQDAWRKEHRLPIDPELLFFGGDW